MPGSTCLQQCTAPANRCKHMSVEEKSSGFLRHSVTASESNALFKGSSKERKSLVSFLGQSKEGAREELQAAGAVLQQLQGRGTGCGQCTGADTAQCVVPAEPGSALCFSCSEQPAQLWAHGVPRAASTRSAAARTVPAWNL